MNILNTNVTCRFSYTNNRRNFKTLSSVRFQQTIWDGLIGIFFSKSSLFITLSFTQGWCLTCVSVTTYVCSTYIKMASVSDEKTILRDTLKKKKIDPSPVQKPIIRLCLGEMDVHGTIVILTALERAFVLPRLIWDFGGSPCTPMTYLPNETRPPVTSLRETRYDPNNRHAL